MNDTLEKNVRASQRVASVLEIWSRKNKVDRKQALTLLETFAACADAADRKQMQKVLELAVDEFVQMQELVKVKI